MNYDCRLLASQNGMGSTMLPQTIAPLELVSWTLLDYDPNALGVY